jgi:hypothetical protein
LSAQGFAQRGPLEIVLAGDKAAPKALVEGVRRANLAARALESSEHAPIGNGRHPVDGQPAAYRCRNRTWTAAVTTAQVLIESSAA